MHFALKFALVTFPLGTFSSAQARSIKEVPDPVNEQYYVKIHVEPVPGQEKKPRFATVFTMPGYNFSTCGIDNDSSRIEWPIEGTSYQLIGDGKDVRLFKDTEEGAKAPSTPANRYFKVRTREGQVGFISWDQCTVFS
jgi:hypothetical protein